MENEFKGTKGEWLWEENSASNPNDSTCIDVRANGPQIAYLQSFTGWGDGHSREATIANANLISAAPELLEALQWAFPMAIIAMEQHRMERVKNGHIDISGTYKNGESWVGIYQDEIDKIEFARAAIAKALGEFQ
ncbi:hypothetical protein S13b_00038 [Klebsiella phage VLCpiS13b]|uniref:hypothetical protein n=1 Tax=Klebsiella phage VLCpiS13b TaxID=2874886 RepID=UPI00233EB812|nr:hypothetical protein PRB92_gp38 [Klebsiella phage VLCpiS13b]UVX30615.1 hypothetical protein S13b_00038 [Klebsiella phage VLCpiS13b]